MDLCNLQAFDYHVLSDSACTCWRAVCDASIDDIRIRTQLLGPYHGRARFSL